MGTIYKDGINYSGGGGSGTPVVDGTTIKIHNGALVGTSVTAGGTQNKRVTVTGINGTAVEVDLNNDPTLNVISPMLFNETVELQKKITGGTTGQALIKQSNTDGDFDWADTGVGDLSALTTTDKSSAVAAINEIDFAVKGLGEPFRVKQWGDNTLNVEIPYCTEDIGNTSIAKMTFSIDAEEGAEYQIVGMIAYEVFDAESGGNRINCWPVCQFTGNGQKELSVRWMCGGTTRKTAKSISAWVLLKHR